VAHLLVLKFLVDGLFALLREKGVLRYFLDDCRAWKFQPHPVVLLRYVLFREEGLGIILLLTCGLSNTLQKAFANCGIVLPGGLQVVVFVEPIHTP
jgi:hypothetical protein